MTRLQATSPPPSDTGSANAFSTQYKRIAALTCDWLLNAPQRQLIDKVSANRTVYNFVSARANFAGIVYPHTSHLLNAFGPGDMTDYFIRFVNDVDPNGASGIYWPPYNATARLTLQFNDGSVPLNVTVDNARLAGSEEISALIGRFPL